MSDAATYQNLEIKPYQLSEILDLTISKRLNEHGRLSFTGIIPSDQKDDYIKDTEAQTAVEVNQNDSGETTALFKGIVTLVQVKTVGDNYYLHVEAASATYLLDVEIKSRSFQNAEKQTYTDLIDAATGDYSNAQVNDTASQGAQLKQLVVQYRETDWQFLKRLASRLYAPLIPTCDATYPKFYFGITDGNNRGKLENFHYTIRKKLSDFRTITQNSTLNLQETDFIEYDLETLQAFELGDNITFQSQSLYIREVVTRMQQGILKHNYLLTPQGGLSQNKIYNRHLTGASIQGQVLAVEKDKVRVHLTIDSAQKTDEAYWFPYVSAYTAEGNSGWYCMPEVDDKVKIYFPDHKEENGVALSSVRQNSEKSQTNKVDDPDIKYFRTKSGKELMFAPGEVLLSAKDGSIFIRLNDDDGIEIYSQKGIQLVAKEDLSITGQKKVTVSAQKELSITCKGSSIKLDGQTTIKGSKIKSN